MKLQPELKKRKVDAAPSPRTSSAQKDDNDSAKALIDKLTGPIAQTSKNNLKIQQAKNFAVAQAQQEHCTGNYRIFDSPFGNFLVPTLDCLGGNSRVGDVSKLFEVKELRYPHLEWECFPTDAVLSRSYFRA